MGYITSVGDIHLNGLKIAKKRNINNLYQFDLLKSPFIEEFDVVGLFDVIEHIEYDKLALQNTHKMLKNKGYLILTVPAHMWLWGNYDIIGGHKRRYSHQSICKLLKDTNFKIINAKNFFITLIPVLLLRKYLQRNETSSSIIIENTFKINPLINFVFNIITFLEIELLKYLPNTIGGSIIVIAQKES